jgi:16S rRNA (cytidine1402-2'-O)-methyltransferase
MKGTLYLIPNTLGDDAREDQLLHVLPKETLHQAAQLRYWIVENAKTARSLLKAVSTQTPLICPLQEMQMSEWRGPGKEKQIPTTSAQPHLKSLLQPLLDGHDMGLMSEAGLPAIADPGSDVVLAAHQLGITVRAMVGPSSLLLALMSSGMNGQSFAFQGYLPVKEPERVSALKQLEQESKRKQQTQLWIETPYRNGAMIEAMLQTLQGNTLMCVAADLSLPTAWVNSKTVSAWQAQIKKEPELLQALHQRPAVFLMLAH